MPLQLLNSSFPFDIFPPFFIILSFSSSSVGLWSLVKFKQDQELFSGLNLPNKQRLSPKFIEIRLFWVNKIDEQVHPDDDISIFELLIKDEFVSIKVLVIIFDMDSIGDLLISIFEFNIFFFNFSDRFKDINQELIKL